MVYNQNEHTKNQKHKKVIKELTHVYIYNKYIYIYILAYNFTFLLIILSDVLLNNVEKQYTTTAIRTIFPYIFYNNILSIHLLHRQRYNIYIYITHHAKTPQEEQEHIGARLISRHEITNDIFFFVLIPLKQSSFITNQ